jgi:hypothetical protein
MAQINLLDPKIYITNFLKIRNKEAELVPFIPNIAQKKLRATLERLRAEGKPARIIILKARQMGFSTYAEGDCFHQTVTHKYFNSTIIAHEDSASQNLYNMFKTYYDNIPDVIKPMRKRNNAKELLFENPTVDDIEKRKNPGLMSSVKVATAKNTATGRSQTIHYLHCSEVAFWDNPKETVTGLFQCVPRSPKTTIILESTANGVGDYFYETWQDAVNGRNNFVPLFFAWFEHDEYQIPFDSEDDKQSFIDEVEYTFKDSEGRTIHTEEYELMKAYPEITYEKLNWRRWCIANNCYGDVEKFHQEYPSNPEEAFIASGRPRFNVPTLRKYLTKARPGKVGRFEYKGSSVIFTPDESGNVEMWKDKTDTGYYAIGADVAEGLITGDYSNAYVGDTDFNICCRWRGHIDPDLYGKELVKMAKYYNEAYIGVENNNHGLTTLKSIQAEEYWNIYFTKTYDKIADTISQKVGWSTNMKTKPLMIDKLAEFIRNMYIGMPDKILIMECITYVIDEKGLTNAQEGCHDDTVMSLAILLQLLLEGKGDNYVPYNTEKDTNTVGYNKTIHKVLGMKIRQDQSDVDKEESVEFAD